MEPTDSRCSAASTKVATNNMKTTNINLMTPNVNSTSEMRLIQPRSTPVAGSRLIFLEVKENASRHISLQVVLFAASMRNRLRATEKCNSNQTVFARPFICEASRIGCVASAPTYAPLGESRN